MNLVIVSLAHYKNVLWQPNTQFHKQFSKVKARILRVCAGQEDKVSYWRISMQCSWRTPNSHRGPVRNVALKFLAKQNNRKFFLLLFTRTLFFQPLELFYFNLEADLVTERGLLFHPDLSHLLGIPILSPLSGFPSFYLTSMNNYETHWISSAFSEIKNNDDYDVYNHAS